MSGEVTMIIGLAVNPWFNLESLARTKGGIWNTNDFPTPLASLKNTLCSNESFTSIHLYREKFLHTEDLANFLNSTLKSS